RQSFPSCCKLDNPFRRGVRPGQLPGNSAAVHDQDTIGHSEDLVNLGRDYHNTGAILREAGDKVVDLRFGAHVNAARRLIEKVETGPNEEPFSEDHFLLISPAQSGYRLFQA